LIETQRESERVKEVRMDSPGMRKKEKVSEMAVIGLSRVILEGFL
jgi:hypothetical protein